MQADGRALGYMGLCDAMTKAQAEDYLQEVRWCDMVVPGSKLFAERTAIGLALLQPPFPWDATRPCTLNLIRYHTHLTSRRTLHLLIAPVQLDSWNLAEDGEGQLLISREWRAKSFVKALELCDRIAEVAEEEGHHPDLHVTGGAVQG